MNQITNSDFSDAKAVQKLADAWHQTPACKTLSNRLESPHPAPIAAGATTECMSGLRQLRALIARAVMNSVRDPAAYALRCVCVRLSRPQYLFEGDRNTLYVMDNKRPDSYSIATTSSSARRSFVFHGATGKEVEVCRCLLWKLVLNRWNCFFRPSTTS